MGRFIFVVLHYKTLEDTIECIKSLESIDYNKIKIVIVDNASNNGSIESLEDKYKNNNKIHIIKSKINLGFAKGNNLGFIYAKEKLNANYICLLNNDTIINDKNFVNKCIEEYYKEDYHILGPDIISLVDFKHQNLHKNSVWTIKDSITDIIMTSTYIYMPIVNRVIRKTRKIISNIKKDKKQNQVNCENKKIILKNDKQGVLHGCCLIFSPIYVERFDGLYNKTFMYREEVILNLIAHKLNLKMEYNPELKVFHKEGSSTKFVYNDKKKEMNKYKFYLKSSKLLLKLMLKKSDEKYLEMQLKK